MGRASPVRQRLILRAVSIVSAAFMAACTRASVDPLALGQEGSYRLTARSAQGRGGEAALNLAAAYAVVWADQDAGLPIRQPAGISSTSVEVLPHDARGLFLTGNHSLLGSSLWVEIARPQGGTGWVPFWNLTEEVAGTGFCSDTRMKLQRELIETAVQSREGTALATAVSSKRGLAIRVDWWNTEILVPPEAVPGIFEATVPAVWGLQTGNGSPIYGSFRELILPGLDELFQGDSHEACGRLVIGATGRPVEWPPEYANLNLYAYHLPAGPTETTFGWRTWVMAFEYVNGQPYLAGLVQLRGEIAP